MLSYTRAPSVEEPETRLSVPEGNAIGLVEEHDP
jgi:hypothetical protein